MRPVLYGAKRARANGMGRPQGASSLSAALSGPKGTVDASLGHKASGRIAIDMEHLIDMELLERLLASGEVAALAGRETARCTTYPVLVRVGLQGPTPDPQLLRVPVQLLNKPRRRALQT